MSVERVERVALIVYVYVVCDQFMGNLLVMLTYFFLDGNMRIYHIT